MRGLFAAAVASAAIVGIATGVVLHDVFGSKGAQARPALPALYGQATWKRGEAPAPAFTLRDQRGRQVSLASLRGRSAVLAFMDSLCTAECPIEARQLAAAIRAVPVPARPRLAVVSVDIADTPRTIAAAVRKWHLPAGTEWLVGTHAELARVWRAYGIEVRPVQGDIAHTDAFYVLDGRGDERAGFATPFLPGLLAIDLRRLAAGV
jgi:cytochrome oxidase Cu insertion factor (SCO1/SenC/PrrC family)